MWDGSFEALGVGKVVDLRSLSLRHSIHSASIGGGGRLGVGEGTNFVLTSILHPPSCRQLKRKVDQLSTPIDVINIRHLL